MPIYEDPLTCSTAQIRLSIPHRPICRLQDCSSSIAFTGPEAGFPLLPKQFAVIGYSMGSSQGRGTDLGRNEFDVRTGSPNRLNPPHDVQKRGFIMWPVCCA